MSRSFGERTWRQFIVHGSARLWVVARGDAFFVVGETSGPLIHVDERRSLLRTIAPFAADVEASADSRPFLQQCILQHLHSEDNP